MYSWIQINPILDGPICVKGGSFLSYMVMGKCLSVLLHCNSDLNIYCAWEIKVWPFLPPGCCLLLLGGSVFSHPLSKRFPKGLCHLCLPQDPLAPQWSLSLVLTHLCESPLNLSWHVPPLNSCESLFFLKLSHQPGEWVSSSSGQTPIFEDFFPRGKSFSPVLGSL